jgi:hypothetical protein
MISLDLFEGPVLWAPLGAAAAARETLRLHLAA